MSSSHSSYRLAFLAVIFVLGSGVSPASAGIVNVQSILATAAKPGLSGAVTGSVDFRTGNRPRLYYRLAPVARYRAGDHLFIGFASVDYFRDTDDLLVFEHLRYRYRITQRFLGETFVQHERNDKRLLGLRALAGFGAKYQLVDGPGLRVGVGLAYMLEYEALQEQVGFELQAPEQSPAFNHRISSYVTGSYEIDDRVQLVETVYGQPRITRVSDFRLLSESALVIKLSKRLAFRSSFTLAYDSEPPRYLDPANPQNPDTPVVKSLDTALLSAITYEF